MHNPMAAPSIYSWHVTSCMTEWCNDGFIAIRECRPRNCYCRRNPWATLPRTWLVPKQHEPNISVPPKRTNHDFDQISPPNFALDHWRSLAIRRYDSSMNNAGF